MVAAAGSLATALLSVDSGRAFASDAEMTAENQIIVDRALVEADMTDTSHEGVAVESSSDDVMLITEPETQAEVPQIAEKNIEEDLPKAASLRELVSLQPESDSLSREMECLAGTVYFESKGESLDGQLAVAEVVLARRDSRRWPNSICGVVYQKSQFSFVRGGSMPYINKSSAAWKRAVAIANIARDKSWESPVSGSYFFHARYVSPNWRLQRVGSVDNHIFYR